ncbi:nucleotidyltransferase family protein [Candidatus Daviesbacteria bacterium]|nr:nucleotidyltransferase family protein [Candidatus Daviesbacteria bacterium]
MRTDVKQIKNIINKHIDFLRNTYNVKDIGVFGSVARGQNTQSSDVDVLVEFSEPLGFFKFIELEEFLSKIIGKKVDLVTKKALKPAIRQEVLQEVTYV